MEDEVIELQEELQDLRPSLNYVSILIFLHLHDTILPLTDQRIPQQR